MGQLTLAQQAEFQRYSKQTRREQFVEEMDTVMPWGSCWRWLRRTIQKAKQAASRLGLKSCYGSIFCSSGSRFPARRWKMRSMNRRCCGALPASLWAAPRRRTRRPFSTSAICSKRMLWAARCWLR